MGQSRDFLSRSRLSRGTIMRDSPAKICPSPARPADFCPGPDYPVALSPGPGPHPGDLRDQDRDPVESRDNRPSLVRT